MANERYLLLVVLLVVVVNISGHCYMTQRVDFPNHTDINVKNQLIPRVSILYVYGDLYVHYQ